MRNDSDNRFCGDSAFWDTSTVDSAHPRLSECFQQTALTFLPCGWLWLTAGFHLVYLRRHTRFISLPITRLHTARLSVAATLGLVSGIHLFLPLQEDKSFPPSFFLSQLLWLITYFLASILMVLSRRYGVMTPCVVFIFWLLTVAINIVPLYTAIVEKFYRNEAMRFDLQLITSVLIGIEFSLQLTGDTQVNLTNASSNKNPCPAMVASFVSKLTYSWMSNLVYQCYKTSMDISGIFEVPGQMQCRHNIPEFMTKWGNELYTAKSLRNKNQLGNTSSVIDARNQRESAIVKSSIKTRKATNSTRLLSQPTRAAQKTKKEKSSGKTPSLYRALIKMYALPLLKAHTVGFMGICLHYASPLLLGRLISYIDKKDEVPRWQGYAIAVSLFAVSLVAGILETFCFYCCNNTSTRIKTVLAAAVYKKTLTMNAAARRKFSVGTIVNLVSVDCQQICDLSTRLYLLIMWPFEILITFFMLYYVLGVAAIVGIVGLLVLIPANAHVMGLLRRTQTGQLVCKDHRIKLVNEILNGVKVMKLYAWEPPFEKKVLEARRLEVMELRKTAVLNALITLCWVVSPALVTVTTFASYIFITGNSLTPSKAFVTIDLINLIKAPMQFLPNVISLLTQSQVSFKRLHRYLTAADLGEACSSIICDDFPIQMKKATFTWDRSSAPFLQNISMAIPRGKLIAVVGPVGAGKSSLLSAMLREMEKLQGESSLTGHVAYVPQQAWILNLTLRDNILLNKPLDQVSYQEVLSACALTADIDLLPGADFTEIGEKGANLSGGQRQRVSLARAVYQDADVYLLDDPLSAVDAQVGKHIFHNVIGPQGIIKDKTRLMVTHGVHWLPLVDAIIVMDQGKITEAGTYEQLMMHDGPLAQFVRTYQLEHQDEVLSTQADKKHIENEVFLCKKQQNIKQNNIPTECIKEKQYDTIHTCNQSQSKKESILNQATGDFIKKDSGGEDDTRLIEEEAVEEGNIRLTVYATLLRSFGFLPAAVACVFLILHSGANMAAGFWLTEWTNDDFLANRTNKGTDKYSSDTGFYIGIYSVLVLAQVIGNAIFMLLVYVQMVNASQRLHNSMLNNILHQSMAFFDSTPVGRILNRFSRDVDVLDVVISRLFWVVLHHFLNICVTIIFISYSTPIFLVVLPPLLFLYVKIQRFYTRISLQFRRLELKSRSPILSHLTDTEHGVTSIRAYRLGDSFFSQYQDIVDTNNKCNFVTDTSTRWIKVRLKLLTSTLVLFTCLFAVTSEDLSASMAGLSVTSALQVTFSMNMLVQYIAQQETNIVSCERVVDYANLPHEPEWITPDTRPSPEWPGQGRISFHNYSTRYRPNLELVLKDVSFTVEPGQKVGIVGRTGAGKSSLTVALFRMIEASGGAILIDDLDISTIGLHDLRAGLTILPQDPILFSGTVRFNLDPFEIHSDAAIWEALGHAHLSSCVKELPEQLEYICEEGGQNLSVGQRQLLCLARSLLRKTRILVLDEATAAVDLETDAILQETIREAFTDCTVLTVAHRLNTVMDYDKILVLENGEVSEYGSPSELLQRTSGIFYKMARHSGMAQ
ncbi:hypothetical protein RRG08_000349 [Elysia crispata]|uniref:ABC-type glutathione-S-conjugate transporter n=1 Tax=Elysia crispata TaxID=231223 RepID=A0AAE0ZV83_9GAST|nr:hypothetical protein RRG08_000349 [Elysia crispata]